MEKNIPLISKCLKTLVWGFYFNAEESKYISVQSRNNRNLVIYGVRAHKTGILFYVRTKNPIYLLDRSEV